MSSKNHPTAKFDTWSFDEPVKSLSSWNSLSQVDLVLGGDYKKKEEEEPSDLVFLCHSGATLEGQAKDIDSELNGALSKLLEETYEAEGEEGDSAKAGSTTPTLRIMGTKPSKKYILVSLGKAEDADSGKTGTAVGKAVASKCIDEGSPTVQTAALLLPTIAFSDAFVKELTVALYSALYTDHRFRGSLKSIKKPKISAQHLKTLRVDYYSESEAAAPPSLEPYLAAIQEGKTIAKGVLLARDIVNAPHNVLNSLSLADLAKTIASESDCLTCQILDKDDCEKRGMGAYLGVARASETPPQFIHMTYKPPSGSVTKKVGVVGKGLLFDTGGYNIKTAMMELMKFDCGGSAAVLGAAKTIGALKPPGVECHFVVAACENMINDKGYVPSDVLVASNGVTIEVLNTDAEGRLTLADALVYCDKELECEKIIELSTLTGSCMIALGKEVCGVFTENDDLAKELEDVSASTGEQSWRMPLVKSYEKQLESKIADISNCGTRFGGSITAGLFLQHFVDTKKVPFAHIDIAGPVWDDKSGATGFGSKLVTQWVRSQGK